MSDTLHAFGRSVVALEFGVTIMAKVLLDDCLGAYKRQVGLRGPLRQWVDDLNTMHDGSSQEVIEEALSAAELLQHKLQLLNMVELMW